MGISGLRRAGALLTLLLAGTAAAQDIALLLPQSGRLAKAGEAIRSGFLAAYYQDSAGNPDSPILHFYDSEVADIAPLLQEVARDGAGLVVGPLERERVEALLKAGPLPVPVLALNSADGQAENLVEFALAPEDEIQRLVAWMRRQGLRRPLLLAAGDEASQRQLKIFQAAWAAHDASELPLQLLDPARKGGIAVAIRELARSSGNHDAFFLASPALARQVQPALTYYRSPLPLYTLASAWDPMADASGQKDLDGVRFCDLPWMLTAEPGPEQARLYEILPRPAGGYDRLYAFGADAWTLTRLWPQLAKGEALPLRTGLLRPMPNGHLQRTPTCAEVRDGTAFPLWSPGDSETSAGSGR